MYLLEVEVEQLFVAIHNNECPSRATGHPGVSCPTDCVSSGGCQQIGPQALYMIVVTLRLSDTVTSVL